MKKTLIRIYYFLIQLGFDFRKIFRMPIGLLKYLRQLIIIIFKYKGNIILNPQINDWYESAGNISDEYFVQDLFVARKIFEKKPVKHVDIGSRIDGFVSNVASFMDIEILDIRTVNNPNIGIDFNQLDLMDNHKVQDYIRRFGKSPSLSCLHTLEHFGLGRYGDNLDINGYKKGFENIVSILDNDGLFYFSTPIGIPRIEFNANRVFSFEEIFELARTNSLKICSLNVISGNEGIRDISIDNNITLALLSKEVYNLGIFIFKKTNEFS